MTWQNTILDKIPFMKKSHTNWSKNDYCYILL